MPDPRDAQANSQNQPPKLHIDSDWKAQAQAEKERLAQREAERDAKRGPEQDEFPPADFKALMGVLVSQALMGLGAYGDEQGRMIVDLPGARFAIDLLGVLEEKTKGNLSAEEAQDLGTVLSQLRSRFMQLATLVAQQMQAKAGAGAPGGAPSLRIDSPLGGGAGAPPAKKPVIEMP